MIMDINSLTIEEAGMSVRSTNALHRASIHTIGDMLKQTEDTLSEINNLGKRLKCNAVCPCYLRKATGKLAHFCYAYFIDVQRKIFSAYSRYIRK